MANIIKRVWNQNRMVQIEDLKGMTFQAEAAGHTFQISGIDDDGNTVALTGTPSGVLLRPDNTDVALTCSVSGGVVSATLPANCYDVPGRFGLTIFITSGSSKTAIYAAVGTVTRTSSGTVAPGTSQSVVDLINAINAAVNSIPASYSALLADIAPTYSDSALYSVGQYAWYDGDLKRCIVPITTAESYTAAHWTSAVLGQDVSDLNSTLNKVSGLTQIDFVGTNQYIKTNGVVGSVVNLTPQGSTGFKYAIIDCEAGDKFLINATGGQSPRVWCFIDSSNKITRNDPTNNHTVTDLVLTAQAGETKLILNDKTGSLSYKGIYRMAVAEENIIEINQHLNNITGGEYQTIAENANLNSYTTPGNYYTSTSAIAASILNSPISVPFKLHVEYSLPGVTTRVTQTVEPCYGFTKNTVRYIRSLNTSTFNTTGWQCFATDDEVTYESKGLMIPTDKQKLDMFQQGNLENIDFPSVISSVADLLNIEKTYCVLHDNYARPDNATEIGYNGSGTFKMAYTRMDTGASASEQLAVGIASNKAIATNPNDVENAKTIMYRNLGKFPYKACMSFDGEGALAISAVDTSNYILLDCTNNGFAISGVGNVICESLSVTHNGNCSDVTVYVYPDKIRIYVADEYMGEVAATSKNAYCGLYFSSDKVDTIKYTNFCLFLATVNIPVGIDNAIEKCGALSATFLGFMAQADPSYGITFNSEIVNHSLKSIRFEQRKADSMGGTYRSEITPPYMRARNYPLQTKVFSFDIYFPDNYNYDSRADVLWQMHHTPDNVNPDAMYPNMAFSTNQGHMYIGTRTYAGKASDASDAPATTFDIGEVEKEKWIHFDIFMREGYLPQHNPVIAVYKDGKNVVMSKIPNGYNTTEGSYLKMGMYKSAWTTEVTENNVRIVYFDNVKIWQ